uniref:Putative site-specific DNA endonuclease n=1 Tax=Chloroidium sp. UTEX 3077 TaxID=2686440 RepID=A0A6B9EUW0_9CHLO|nr:putative site-specific DNA endonuclease [Chloroidium sp. UTEX 3077]
MIVHKRKFYSSRIYSNKRVGPHNLDVISVLVGGLLGYCYGEKRNNSTRFVIHASSTNVEYIYSLHKLLYKNGYCSAKKPGMRKEIGKNNKVYFSIKFRTFSFTSLNFLHDIFYNESKEKIISFEIHKLLNRQAFAIWFVAHGGISGSGLMLSTGSFAYKDVVTLQRAIHQNFKILPTIQRHKQAHVLYFKKEDKEDVFNIIKDFLVDSMLYKFK